MKMSIEEFRRIKNRIIEMMSLSASDVKPEEEEALVKELFGYMDEITSHDLSDIPFEEWEGMCIFSEGRLDMSKTHANLDFALLQEAEFESIDLRGCNVRNLGAIRYDEESFDKEFVDNHPEFFPSKDIPDEVRERFYDRKIVFADLINYPSLKQCVHEKSFDGTSESIVELIGLEYALRMLEEYPDLLLKVTEGTDRYSYSSFHFSKDIKFEGGSYEEAKDAVFKNIIYNVELRDFEIMGTDLIPEEMKKKHPEVFFDVNELPEEIVNDYTKGRLNLYQIRKYYDALKDKNIKVGIRSSYNLRNLIELYGSLEKVLSDLPPELDGVMASYVGDNWWSKRDEIKELFATDVEKLYRIAIIDYINRNNNYYLRTVDVFSKYVPLDRMIPDDKVIEFINYFGMDNILEFNDKYDFVFERSTSDYFSTDYSETFLGIIAKQEKIPYNEMPKSLEGLEQFVKNIIDYTRDYNNRGEALTGSVSHYGKALSKLAPDKYIDYEAAKELFKDLDSYRKGTVEDKLNSVLLGNFDSLLEIIKEYPKMVVLFKGRNITFIDVPIVNDAIKVIGMDTFIDICAKYIEVIDYAKRVNANERTLNNLLAPIIEGEEPERAINKFIYDSLAKNNQRICDIENLPESFKKAYPDLFLPDDPNVPEGLRRDIRGYRIWGSYSKLNISQISHNPEWIPFLEHMDLTRTIEPIRMSLIDSENVDTGSYHYYGNHVEVLNMFEFLKQYMSNREMLEFLCQYSFAFNYETVIGIPKNEIKDNNIKEVIKNTIYRRILERSANLSEDVPSDFKTEHPDIFLPEDAPEQLKNAFYQRRINYELLLEHPEWDEYLEGKVLYAVLDRNISMFTKNRHVEGLSNKDYLYLIRKYGKYLGDDRTYSMKGSNLAEAEESLRGIIASMIRSSFAYGEDAFELVGDLCPEMFLDPSAPQELKDSYYHQNNMGLDFFALKKHRDWLPYLDGKNVVTSMGKAGLRTYTLEEFFRKAGVREGLLIGMKNPDAVTQMLIHNNVDLLLQWYNRIKFVPHYAVMTAFPVEEADKFMAAGKLWSQIMRIEGHNDSLENVDAMLKVAYVFGVFDGDREGFGKFMQLFTGVPGKVSKEEFEAMENAASSLFPFKDEEIEAAKETLKGAYVLGEDDYYHIQIDPQSRREEASLIRRLAESANLKSALSALKAHQIFGGFALKYDPSFRDFFMANLEEILDPDNDYFTYMANIQKQWTAIKTVNSNRVLTLALAKDFVLTNKYVNVEVGNEQLAQSSSEAGYSQEDFDKLQEIYNYGKERVHSSIPRISGSIGRYNYELLRLDDAYATAIGTLTDCCQEIGDCAEVCMEHSMVSEHGRVFVIRDSKGNIEAQSWVWRNKNVLCFDNIEIPHKAFNRASALNLTREEYADQILEVYRKAAEEIIAADEAMYKSLLEAGRITEQQYEALRIRKVTAGAGYNDIKESLQRNTESDHGKLARPLHFREPVPLTRSLYTNDSGTTQFILAGEEKVPESEEETLPVYTEEFKVITKETMNERYLKMMERIELAGRTEDSGNLYVYSKDHILENIANNYGLNPNTTEVVIHPNFFIIYCVNGNTIYLGDIVRNVKVNSTVQERDITDTVNLQIGLALKQIKGDREFDLSMLDEAEIEIFNQATSDEQKDSERGFTHGM